MSTHLHLARVLDTIASRSPHAHLILGPDGRIEHANVAASILFGADTDDIVGTPMLRWTPDLRSDRDDPSAGMEMDLVTAQSDRIPVEVSITPLDDGESRAWIVLHDITRRRGLEGSVRRHAEELEKIVATRAKSLSGLHQKVRTLYDVAPLLDFTIDSQGAIASANRKASLSLGVPIERLVGIPLIEVVLPDHRGALQKSIEAACAGAAAPFETKLRSADGSSIDVLFHPTTEEAGARGSLRLLGLDITARRDAERLVDQSLDLAESQRARMERILRSIAEGIVVTDADGQVRLMNGIAESLLGIEERTAFGRDLFADQRDARFVDAWAEFVVGDRDVLRTELNSVERESRAILTTISRIRTAEGRPAGAVIVLRDASVQRNADQESRELVLNVALSLRGSIASMRGFTGTLVRDENAPPATTRRFLGLLAKEANRVHRTIEHLLALARLDAGHDFVNIAAGDLLQVLHEVETSFAPGTRARGIRFQVRAADLDGNGRFDADKVRRILDHLIVGAMKRATTGGEISVELRRDGGRFHLEVRDDGPVAPPEELDLGAVLVARLVALHGGALESKSEKGSGSVSSFWIPIDPTSTSEPAAADIASDAPVATSLPTLPEAALPAAPTNRTPGRAQPIGFPDALVDDPDGDITLTFLEKSPLEEV